MFAFLYRIIAASQQAIVSKSLPNHFRLLSSFPKTFPLERQTDEQRERQTFVNGQLRYVEKVIFPHCRGDRLNQDKEKVKFVKIKVTYKLLIPNDLYTFNKTISLIIAIQFYSNDNTNLKNF